MGDMEETRFGSSKGVGPVTTQDFINGSKTDSDVSEFYSKEQEQGGTKFTKLFKNNRLQTITYCSVFWSFGLCVAFLGPTLPDLQCMVSSVLNDVSWVFFAQSLFTLIGAAFAGIIERRFGNNNILLVSTTIIAATLALIPCCKAMWTLAIDLAIMGYFMGIIDSVANMSMIQLYGNQVAPFLQALHFFYGLGAFVSPMVAQPFVSDTNCEDVTVSSYNELLSLTNVTYDQKLKLDQDVSKIKYAFWILSSLQIPIILLILLLIIRLNISQRRECIPNMSTPIVSGKEAIEMASKNGPTSDVEDIPTVTMGQICKITSCIGLLLFIYDGLQAGFGGYIFSYAMKSNSTDMSSNSAAYLNACFWGNFALGRLLSIWISTRISPLFMLLGNISGCFISMMLMIAVQNSTGVLYLGTCMFGIFMSSVYPTAITLADMYIPVTSTITSILVVSAATGEMVMPVTIGHAFHKFGPVSLLVFGLFLTIFSFFVHIVLFAFGQDIMRHSADLNIIGRLKDILKGKPKMPKDEDTGLMVHHVKHYRRMKSDISEASSSPYNEANT